MVPAVSRRIPRVLRYSGILLDPPCDFAYGAVTLFGRASLHVRLSLGFSLSEDPTTPGGALPRPGFGLLRFRSPLLAESLLFSLPAGTEMFQFPAFARRSRAVTASLPPGFPIRTSAVVAGICPSPPLFAACHVLLRLREPQASPMRPSLLSFFFSPCSSQAPLRLFLTPARLFGSIALTFVFCSSLSSRVSSELPPQFFPRLPLSDLLAHHVNDLSISSLRGG